MVWTVHRKGNQSSHSNMYEKTPNLTNYQGNGNLNTSELPFYAHLTGKCKNLTTPSVVKDLERQAISHIAGRVSTD